MPSLTADRLPNVKVPEGHPMVGDTSEPCPFLTPQDRNANANIPPANNGRVPRALPAIVFLDILAVGLVIPLLSKFAKDLGGGAAFTGVLGTAYGATQLFGASVLGSWSDVHGRRKVYLLSVVGAIVGYSLLLAAAAHYRSLPLLFASRLPIGLVKQTMTVSQSIICDCTSVGAARSVGLSRLGVAAGMGFIVGPMAGGILSSKSTYLPVKLAVALFFVELAIVYLRLPETSPASRGFVGDKSRKATAAATTATTTATAATTDAATAAAADAATAAPLPTAGAASASAGSDAGRGGAEVTATAASAPAPSTAAVSAVASASSADQAGLKFLFKYRAIRDCLMSMFLVDMSYSIMHASFSIYTHEEYNMVPKQTGFTLAYVGILSVGVQLLWPFIGRRLRACIAGRQRRRSEAAAAQPGAAATRTIYPEYYLALTGASLMALSFFGIVVAPGLPIFLAALAPLAVGHALYSTSVNYLLSVSCKQTDIGALHGTVDSMRALCRAVAPMIGGVLIQFVTNAAPWMVACAASAFGMALLGIYLPKFKPSDMPVKKAGPATAAADAVEGSPGGDKEKKE